MIYECGFMPNKSFLTNYVDIWVLLERGCNTKMIFK